LALSATGILAVTAENPLTLLLAWALIDLGETITLLRAVTHSHQRERVVITFFVRVFGLMLVVAAMLRALSAGVALAFDTITIESASYLILAAGLRLGVIPPHPPFFQEGPSRRGLATIVRLVPVAASLLVLSRVSSIGVITAWRFPLMATALWALASGAITWVTSSDELDGRPYWILALSSYAVAAAVLAQPEASQAWGLATLFSGGVLFLYSTRSSKLIGLPLVGLLGITALPFTPAWHGAGLFAGGHLVFGVCFLVGLVFIIGGYFKHLMRVDPSQPEIERWTWLVYPTGLALLPLSHWVVVWLGGGLSQPLGGFNAIFWLSGGGAVVLAGLFWVLRERLVPQVGQVVDLLSQTFSLRWFYRFLWWSYRTTSRFVEYLARVFEEEGGILWALLIIILLVLIIVQPGLGG
jgi:hypothetical protein